MYKNVGLEDLRFCINEIRTCTSLNIWDEISPDAEVGVVVKRAYERVLHRLSSLNDATYIRDNLDDLHLEWVLGNLLKKFRHAPSSFARTRKEEAVKGFLQRNSEAKGHRVSRDVRYVMRDLLSRWLPKPTLGPAPFRMGPGAVCDVPRATHFDKFTQLVKQQILRVPFVGVGGELNPWACGGLNTAPCRLCAVPKDYYRDRLITVEPSSLAFGQQEARHVIYQSIAEGPLRKRPINHVRFRDPTAFFRARALEGSRTGNWATIDLSNASDLISWDDVVDVFPSWLVSMLECVRSAQFASDGEIHDMHMYAGMGNATTFVVESLFFRAICHALAKVMGWNPAFQAETFGDDIIMTGLGDQGYIEMMAGLCENGLVVNVDKSYTSSTCLFRESCGMIALAGNSLETFRFYGYSRSELPSLCDLISRMARCENPAILGLTQRLVDSQIGDILVRCGAVMADAPNLNVDGCLAIVPGGLVMPPGFTEPERRWSTPYQKWEYRMPVVQADIRPRRYRRTDMDSSLFDAAAFWTHLYGVALPARGDDRVVVSGSTQRPRFRWRWRG